VHQPRVLDQVMRTIRLRTAAASVVTNMRDVQAGVAEVQ